MSELTGLHAGTTWSPLTDGTIMDTTLLMRLNLGKGVDLGLENRENGFVFATPAAQGDKTVKGNVVCADAVAETQGYLQTWNNNN